MILAFDKSAPPSRALSFGGQTWIAANNVDSHSNGPWPFGEFPLVYYNDLAADGPKGAYGSFGILVFNVPGRSGMGIHSGRWQVPDGLGRSGPFHCTMGCIRTTDAVMQQLLTQHQRTPITLLRCFASNSPALLTQNLSGLPACPPTATSAPMDTPTST
jgi:hypothetical protein